MFFDRQTYKINELFIDEIIDASKDYSIEIILPVFLHYIEELVDLAVEDIFKVRRKDISGEFL